MARSTKAVVSAVVAAVATVARDSVIRTMTDTLCDNLLAFDLANNEFNEGKQTRNDALLTAIETARAACIIGNAYDSGAYLGIVESVLGDNQNGRVKGRVVGTVWEALAGVVESKGALSVAISRAKKIANWYADRTHNIRATDNTFIPLNTLVGMIDGKCTADGKKIVKVGTPADGQTSADAPAVATPASIKVQIAAWVKAGVYVEALAEFANVLKVSNDKAIAEVGAGVADCADELKQATAK